MVTKDNILLVLSIHEGKRFPRRQNCYIIVEAKFDGEILSTDPIDHVECPDFSTELAWELDKKALHQHRLQRTPVKLECFALDKISNSKEPVGYCILDQRSAQKGEQVPQWHPLLSSKYQKLKPEIKLVLSLEEDAGGQTIERELKPASLPEVPKNFLIPILNEKQGYYTINGTDSTGERIVYIISVTLSSAQNLLKLLPSEKYLPENEGFYFYYSLIGIDVITEPFYDLLSCSFSPERASVRVFTNRNTLVEYVRSKPTLKIHLCSGDESLGSTHVSLLPLITDELFTQGEKCTVAGLFTLMPRSGSSELSDTEKDDSAALDLVVTLSAEDEKPSGTVGDGTSPLIASGGLSTVKGRERQTTPSPPAPISKGSKIAEAPEDTKEKEKEQRKEQRKEKPKDIVREPQDQKFLRTHKGRNPIKNSLTRTAHHFCFSIDLRKLKDMQTESTLNCYCRYTYPFFGTSSPVFTHPPVEVSRHSEVLLPHSFCAFDFATVPDILTETLKRVPLMVEVWHRDVYRKDYLLGIAEVQLFKVLDSSTTKQEENRSTKIFSEIRPVMSNDRRKIGALQVILGVEDLGEVSAKLAAEGPDSTESLCSASMETDNHPRPAETTIPASNEPRSMPEYTAALELEMWKEQQEAIFIETLKQKESEHMKTLAEEWKKRDKEREMILKRKVDEYNKLEEKLKKSISDLEKREKQVSLKEAEVLRTKATLTQEHEQALQHIRESSKRAQESCDHQVHLERMKLKDLQSENGRLKEQLRGAEKRLRDRDNEFLAYREQQFNHPEIKLQAELNLILLEKTELERKLENVTKSKIHYKQQWGRALRELAKLKHTEQTAAKTRLKQQEKELEQMRLRYIASEEQAVVKAEKEELKEVREELERLKNQGVKSSIKVLQPSSVEGVQTPHPQPKMSWGPVEDSSQEVRSNRIAKLIEERDTLLQTGVYSSEDKIITELDRQIRELISKSPK